jgi:hypothetical protein
MRHRERCGSAKENRAGKDPTRSLGGCKDEREETKNIVLDSQIKKPLIPNRAIRDLQSPLRLC